MKTGIIIDGRAEPDALQEMLRKVSGVGTVLRPLYADLQPKDKVGQIAKSAMDNVALLARKVDQIIVLIDREDREDCPPSFALQIEAALRKMGAGQVRVVVKDRAFENWLIADPDALAGLRKRFRISNAFRARVAPNKADRVVDATALLNQACLGDSYRKGEDPARIMKAIDVAGAARNSRSLRRFLRLLGYAPYCNQSKRP